MGKKDKYLWPDAFLASENAFLAVHVKCLYLVRDELTGQTITIFPPHDDWAIHYLGTSCLAFWLSDLARYIGSCTVL